MKYVSTRGGGKPQNFSDILLEGLAPDGGLYLPESLPRADLATWRKLAYPDLALAILAQFMDDVPDLAKIVRASYTKEIFGSKDVTPLKTLRPGFHLLGLSNGPGITRNGRNICGLRILIPCGKTIIIGMKWLGLFRSIKDGACP